MKPLCAGCHKPFTKSFNSSPRCNECQRKRTIARNQGRRGRSAAYRPEEIQKRSNACGGCEPGSKMCEPCAELWREANGGAA